MTYKMTRLMYSVLAEVRDGRGRVIGHWTQQEVINYVNATAGLKVQITEIAFFG